MRNKARNRTSRPGPPPGEPPAGRLSSRRYSRELIEETIAVWQPHYQEPLTDEDAREIIDNMTVFLGGLLGLQRNLPLRGRWSDDSN